MKIIIVLLVLIGIGTSAFFITQLNKNKSVAIALQPLTLPTSQSQSNSKIQEQTQEQSSEQPALFNENKLAPEIIGITKWLNPEKPVSISELKGKVVLIDFWTNQCINCIHTLPYITKWYDTYKDQGFVVIGVHTPELSYERTVGSIEQAIKTYNIHYPVAQDNNYTTWKAYDNQYWPAEYLIDKKGYIRRSYFGEGEYDQTEQAIQELLKE